MEKIKMIRRGVVAGVQNERRIWCEGVGRCKDCAKDIFKNRFNSCISGKSTTQKSIVRRFSDCQGLNKPHNDANKINRCSSFPRRETSYRLRGVSSYRVDVEDESVEIANDEDEKFRGVIYRDSTRSSLPELTEQLKSVEFSATEAAQSSSTESRKILRNESERIRQVLEEARREPLMLSKRIGKEGGTIQLCDFRIEFPEYSLDRETDIAIYVDNNPENFPPGRVPLTSILKCKPSMKFNVPVKITATCNCVARDSLGAEVEVLYKKGTGGWQTSGTMILQGDRDLQFTVTHFCQFGVVLKDNDSKVINLISNVVYGLKRPSIIVSHFYADKKSCIDLTQHGYTQLTHTPIILKYEENQEYEVDITCFQPKNTTIEVDKDKTKTVQVDRDVLSTAPEYLELFPVPDFPQDEDAFSMKYEVRSEKSGKKTQWLQGKWREESNDCAFVKLQDCRFNVNK